jgi:hypothetical protein|tara:strand:+ start:25128 stop:25400 length:273 start_codon:yes stop_codon:yes gene_type:complete
VSKDYWDIIEEADSILGDIFKGISQKDIVAFTNPYTRQAEKDVFVCDKCDKVWEMVTSGWRNRERFALLHYYKEIPRWGKTIKRCKACRT